MQGFVKKLGWAIPAAVVGAAGLGLWIACVRRGDGAGFVGWVGAFLIIATVGGIWCGTASHRAATTALPLFGLFATEIFLLATGAGVLGARQATEISLLATTWIALWSALGWALRRCGCAMAASVTLTFAMVLIASPVIAMPAVHAASPANQGRLVEVIRRGCPILGCLDAVRPNMRVDWAELPGMYAWSGLGQEVPMELPSGWADGAIYGAGAVLMAGAGWVINKKGAARN